MRVLPSEAVLAQLQVTTRLEHETLSTPVAVWNPASWVEALEPGEPRSSWWAASAGGSSGPRARTASRVELEADVVARAGDRRRVNAAIRRVSTALEVLDA